MLLVETKIDKSNLGGLGCFATRFIKKGTKVWEFDSRIDARYSDEDLKNYPDSFAKIVRFYGFTEEENEVVYYILCGDHARHMNHSDNSNLSPNFEENCDYANKDILAGEELTANYYEYYVDPEDGLNKKL